MADVDDRWHKLVNGKKVKTDQFGKGKRWRARWRDDSKAQRSKCFATQAEAKRFLSSTLSDLDSGVYVDPRERQVTFRSYAESWMAAQRHRPTTERKYRQHLARHIYPTFGGMPLASIRRTTVQRWIKGLSLSPATVRLVFKIFSAIISGARDDGRIARSPLVGVTLPDVPRTKVVILEPGEVMRLYEAMQDDPKSSRYAPLILLGAACGLRQGEALGIHRDQVAFLQRTLTVDRQVVVTTRPEIGPPKTKGSVRDVPIPTFAVEALAKHVSEWDIPADAPLFTTSRGNLVRADKWNREVLKPAIKRAGLDPSLTFHDLRHTFASTLLARGVPITEVSRWLGHASITETVDTYGHLVPDASDRGREAIESAFTSDVSRMCQPIMTAVES